MASASFACFVTMNWKVLIPLPFAWLPIFGALWLAPSGVHAAVFPILGDAPPPSQTNALRYDEFAHASFTVMMGGTDNPTRSQNVASLTLIESRKRSPAAALRFMVGDVDLSDANVQSYSPYPEVIGFNVRDEPAGAELEATAATVQRVTKALPRLGTNLVNLLPIYVSPPVIVVPRAAVVGQTGGGDGSWLNRTWTRLGQTFITAANQTAIKKIRLYVDAGQWSSDESLVMSLYDGPARSTLLARRTVTGHGQMPVFDLDVAVLPGTPYYWELTHGGGGDGSVGWIVRSPTDTYANGQAYVNGVAQNNDWFFQIYDQLPGETHLSQMCSDGGTWIDINSNVGQTFVVPIGTTHLLHYVDLSIDNQHWVSGEPITLTIWDSPKKQTQLASSTVANPDGGLMPRFYLNARLEAGRSYYMELSPGQAKGIGSQRKWVFHSGVRCADPYSGGTGYLNSVPQRWDLTFRQAYALGWYEEYIEAWLHKGTPAMLSYDNYPFLIGADRPDHFLNLAIVRERALHRNTPFWAYVQSCGMRADNPSQPHHLGAWIYRNPTATELRWNIYTDLAYGAKGLLYFLYWGVYCNGFSCCDGVTCFTQAVIREDGTPNPVLYPAAQTINAEVKALGPTLLELTSQAVYHAGPLPLGTQQVPHDFFFRPTDMTQPLVLGYSKRADGRKAVLVVNRDYRTAQTVSFKLKPAPPALFEVWKTTGKVASSNAYDMETGLLRLTLAAGDGRLFLLPSGY